MHTTLINKDNIDDLIGKYLSGEADPEEAMLLEDWKAESNENLAYFNDAKRIVDAASGISQQEINPDAAWNRIEVQLEKEVVKELYPKRRYWSIAASLVLVMGIAAIILFYFNQPSTKNISHTTDQNTETIRFSDRSSVTLAANSSITYTEDFGKTNRTIHLKGAAYFEVEHNEQVPFIVDAGNVYIKDIGTRFDVRSSKDTDTIYVKVDEGVVLLFDSAGSELIIKATEKAVYIRSSRKIIKEELLSPENLPKLNFTATKLKDVVEQLKKLYHTNIELENSGLNDCLITTQFNNEPIETVLGIITETLGITYEKAEKGYVIKGNKCNQ